LEFTVVVRLNRAYDPVSNQDGQRILVDRLWPRGVSKAKCRIDRWEKELAPSTELRKWFAHDPEKWVAFQRRYKVELADRMDLVKLLVNESRSGILTLVYAAKDKEHNGAVVLRDLIEQFLR
jgi:uncharacterized protein YeaO (DUF488 family)